MADPVGTAAQPDAFRPRCLSIDLEVGVQDGRIHSFAAVRGDTGAAYVFNKGPLRPALAGLDEFAKDASFLLGHNLIDFDLPHLRAAAPGLELLKLPAVDTLRLNPLAFPRNPYHHLVKHYQDGQLRRGRLNDPELDARLTLEVFRDQHQALKDMHKAEPDLLLAWHWLTTVDEGPAGLNAFFSTVRSQLRPNRQDTLAAMERRMLRHACLSACRSILKTPDHANWALAYALAWLSVAGGNSVMPPWVRFQFPEAGELVRKLRDVACHDVACHWCRERHDARKELIRWFGFSAFRPEPQDADGKSLQQSIVEAAMQAESVLGILPTGTGKSLCYQIPALSRFDKTGALTLVISPLVALMADQVAGLEARGITSCAAINGLLSMPERADVLDRVRLGDIGILIVSPEQLRNRALRKVLAQREIGAWVLDEAHCISKWGHDFRPDYRYVGRFIKEKAGEEPVPPVLCLTATAKPDVIADVLGHFKDKVGVELRLFDGGANRSNLDFAVVPTTTHEKFELIYQILMTDLPAGVSGGGIVYCSSRRQTEEVAQYLRDKELMAAHFHAGLPPDTKKHVQQLFIGGDLRVMVATNAFGMGIDKPDVRIVIHADIPGSLENYLQEAGRAGRDRQSAKCILLYTPEDVERQFGLSARSRLTQREIQAILKSLRSLNRKKKLDGEVIATPGEILAEEPEGYFIRDSATDDTRVRTAISWLEEAALLTRDENMTQVFPSSLRVDSIDAAREKLSKATIALVYRNQLLKIVQTLIAADADEGISTDELMAESGLGPDGIRTALYDLERLGIASNDTALTAFVHSGVERSSLNRYESAAALETLLIDKLREAAPDMSKGDTTLLHLRHATQDLKEAGHKDALPEKIARIVRSISNDGRDSGSGVGSVHLRRLDPETMEVKLQRNWDDLAKTARIRREGAGRLLEHLLACLPPGSRGMDLLAETTLGKLLAALEQDLLLKNEVQKMPKLLDRALLWLHEQEVIRLNKGLAVFRPAMTIRLGQDRRGFVKADFEPLKMHYAEQVVQIHVMAEYVQRGLKAMAEAIGLAMDYFSLDRDSFINRWLPGREKELSLQTTPQSWRSIVEELNNPDQQRMVADDREQTNVLVLAGPGSGKTRVLVHRIAYLLRVKRENPRGVLALAYNRHAAVEIRRRLAALIGDDARGVTVMTCHALAMRLVGASFAGRAGRVNEDQFSEVLRQAVALLKGVGLPPEEADEQRERLLAGFRWILVDEYQDIGLEQYELISALAGRTLQDDEGRLSLFAVGDDDQNIYAFAGASVEFIRRFESEYKARASFLVENYRSTAHIIGAANLVIEPAANRMKIAHPIRINRLRSKSAAGGDWQGIDSVGQGRVQVLPAGADAMTQAVSVITELQRLAMLQPDWNWARCAVIAREWKYLDPVRSYCELNGIPVEMASEDTANIWRLRETQALVDWLNSQPQKLVDTVMIQQWLEAQAQGPWWAVLREAVEAYALETNGAELPRGHFQEWLAEWGREFRRRQTGLLLLTAHRAKGLEFNHVIVLDGAWKRTSQWEDPHAQRRLYYVAMTRAEKTLALASLVEGNIFLDSLMNSAHVQIRAPVELPQPGRVLGRQYRRLSLADIDLSFAGRQSAQHVSHRAIRKLLPGDLLTIEQTSKHWCLLDRGGIRVGRLSHAFAPPPGMHCVEARVMAIMVRRREDSEPEYQNLYKSDRWELVLPELIFEPDENEVVDVS